MDVRYAALAIALTVNVGTPLPASGETVTDFVVLKSTAVRQGPDESEEEITTLLKGDTVISTGSFREKSIVRGTPPICKAGWCFVLANGHYGYVPEGTYRPARSVIRNSAF
jgi:SH3-like domain-containing protein